MLLSKTAPNSALFFLTECKTIVALFTSKLLTICQHWKIVVYCAQISKILLKISATILDLRIDPKCCPISGRFEILSDCQRTEPLAKITRLGKPSLLVPLSFLCVVGDRLFWGLTVFWGAAG